MRQSVTGKATWNNAKKKHGMTSTPYTSRLPAETVRVDCYRMPANLRAVGRWRHHSCSCPGRAGQGYRRALHTENTAAKARIATFTKRLMKSFQTLKQKITHAPCEPPNEKGSIGLRNSPRIWRETVPFISYRESKSSHPLPEDATPSQWNPFCQGTKTPRPLYSPGTVETSRRTGHCRP